MDLEKFEGVSKFYKFLQPLSKRELEKRYKVKEKRKNCLQIKEEKTEESSAYNFQSQINII